MSSIVTAIAAAGRSLTIDYSADEACDVVNKSVHVYRNCSGQSQKHVCNDV